LAPFSIVRSSVCAIVSRAKAAEVLNATNGQSHVVLVVVLALDVPHERLELVRPLRLGHERVHPRQREGERRIRRAVRVEQRLGDVDGGGRRRLSR